MKDFMSFMLIGLNGQDCHTGDAAAVNLFTRCWQHAGIASTLLALRHG